MDASILTSDERQKGYLRDLDAAIVSRGGTSIFAPRCEGKGLEWFTPDAFIDWENENLGPPIPRRDPDDGFYRRYSTRGKLHLVRRT